MAITFALVGFQGPFLECPSAAHTRSCDRAVRAKGRSWTTNRSSGGRAAASTLYDVLEVAEDADMAEIKSAYRQMAKEYHPDVCREGSSQKFLRVQEAYETLSDPMLRASYDNHLLNDHRGGHMPSGSGRWQDQLFHLCTIRSDGNARDTWGARIRRSNQQNQKP